MEPILIILIGIIVAFIGATIAIIIGRILIGSLIGVIGIIIILFFILPIMNQDKFNYNSTVITNPYIINQINGMDVVYPNTTLTPGEVATDDLKMICDKYYSDLLIDVPEKIKGLVFESYNVTSKINTKEYIIDHWIPLALGGSNIAKNVWPQPRRYPGYLEKDVVQRYLREQVCNNKMNLSEARRQITSDWYLIYYQLK